MKAGIEKREEKPKAHSESTARKVGGQSYLILHFFLGQKRSYNTLNATATITIMTINIIIISNAPGVPICTIFQ